ncbi:hypothetical protein [Ruania alba]|nr:hypothetical protein [Ruania alba]
MTDTSPADADSPDTYLCPHCDATHEHEHVDERAVVEAYRQTLLTVAATRLAVAILAVAAVLLINPVLLLAAGGAALGWGVATAAGMGAATVDLARRRVPAGARSHPEERRFVLVSVLTGAALTPLVALGLALLAPAGLIPLPWALAVAAGWFAGAAGAEVIAELRLRRLLATDTRVGEVARENAVRLRERTHEIRLLITVLATAVVVGAEVLLCLWLPVIVVVLIPLHVAVAALTGRWHQRNPLPPA